MNTKKNICFLYPKTIMATIIQEDMTECPVCMDDFNEKCIPITCGCNHKVCIQCCKTYMETSSKAPHCMHCKIEWDRTFLYKVFPNTYVNRTLRNHRKKILMEMEKAKMPDTQNYVAAYKEFNLSNKMIETYRALKKKYKDYAYRDTSTYVVTEFLSIHPEIHTYYPHLEEHLENSPDKMLSINNTVFGFHHNSREKLYLKKAPEKAKFIKACPTDGCRGFLNEKYQCSICNTNVCRRCFAIKTEETHTCKKEDVETANFIKKDTKNCPSCGIPIHKIIGCDQMWCTQCNVAFSWRTGQIETGIIHNPHYYEWRRQHRDGIRNIDEEVCGGLLGWRNMEQIWQFITPHHFERICKSPYSMLFPVIQMKNIYYHVLPIYDPKDHLILTRTSKMGDLDTYFTQILNPIIQKEKYNHDLNAIYLGGYLRILYEKLLHFQGVNLRELREKMERYNSTRMVEDMNYIHRLRYMVNEIDEKHFTTLLTKHDNMKEKDRQILYIYELMIAYFSENTNTLYHNLSEHLEKENKVSYETIRYIPEQIMKYTEHTVTCLDAMKAFIEVLFQMNREYCVYIHEKKKMHATLHYREFTDITHCFFNMYHGYNNVYDEDIIHHLYEEYMYKNRDYSLVGDSELNNLLRKDPELLDEFTTTFRGFQNTHIFTSNRMFSFMDGRFQVWLDFLSCKRDEYASRSSDVYKLLAEYLEKKRLLYVAVSQYLKDVQQYKAFFNSHDEKMYQFMKNLYNTNPTMDYSSYEYSTYSGKRENIYMIEKSKQEGYTGNFGVDYKDEIERNWFSPVELPCATKYAKRFRSQLKLTSMYKIFKVYINNTSFYREYFNVGNNISPNTIRNMNYRIPCIKEHLLTEYTPIQKGSFGSSLYSVYKKEDILDCIQKYYQPYRILTDFVINANQFRNFCNERLYEISKNYNMKVPYVCDDMFIHTKMCSYKELTRIRDVLSSEDNTTIKHDYESPISWAIHRGLRLEKKYRV